MKYWNKELEESINKLSVDKIKKLLIDIWDTVTTNYCGETDTDRIQYIKKSINREIEIE